MSASIDAAHGGLGWQARTTSTREEIGSIWGRFGVSNECGTLRRILLHRPGTELNEIHDPERILFSERMELKLALEQHCELVELYRSHGVDVTILEPRNPQPNHLYVRDLFVMTPLGCVLCRPASTVRAGEELAVMQKMAELQIPIAASVLGTDFFEGPDIVFVNDTFALIGEGIRSGREGGRVVRRVLKSCGIRSAFIQTTFGCGHLDGVLSIVDRNVAVVVARRLSYAAVTILRENGFDIVELDESEIDRMAINMVALAPGLVLIPSGCHRTRLSLEKKGIDSVEVDVSELMKGGGAVHCMTGVIERDPL